MWRGEYISHPYSLPSTRPHLFPPRGQLCGGPAAPEKRRRACFPLPCNHPPTAANACVPCLPPSLTHTLQQNNDTQLLDSPSEPNPDLSPLFDTTLAPPSIPSSSSGSRPSRPHDLLIEVANEFVEMEVEVSSPPLTPTPTSTPTVVSHKWVQSVARQCIPTVPTQQLEQQLQRHRAHRQRPRVTAAVGSQVGCGGGGSSCGLGGVVPLSPSPPADPSPNTPP